MSAYGTVPKKIGRPVGSGVRPVAERFWEKVDKTDGCWLWTASTRSGYGQFFPQWRTCVPAHRWAYENVVGPIPVGLVLDHLCRTPLCVNPDHLEPVTQRENVLRGDTVAARNASKTHCDSGHPLTGENLYASVRGHRICKTCDRERQARHREAHREEWNAYHRALRARKKAVA